ncbi:MAG: PH domain-containing protein [Ilumatobacter sp.]|uniref:PH domain-containing protein n=1 Tax=Ilumatobacter sp. TaxID=1967498 RepID=UPI002610F823|nr:PH domain-containing protein [Ilumatobacter sp.]MDJ0770603.1 PH domain-containing protein [Ilumatobacter sp.]
MTGPSQQPAEFTNDTLDLGTLPRVEAGAFESLDPAYLRMRMVAAGAFGAVVAVAALTVALLSSSWVVGVVGAVLVALVALVALARRIEVGYMGFLVREQDVSYRSGVISRAVATVPFARVQHVAIHRGPLDRRFGLATLQMRTAGGSIAIPGLRVELAERLKQVVADRASELADAEADVADDTGGR